MSRESLKPEINNREKREATLRGEIDEQYGQEIRKLKVKGDWARIIDNMGSILETPAYLGVTVFATFYGAAMVGGEQKIMNDMLSLVQNNVALVEGAALAFIAGLPLTVKAYFMRNAIVEENANLNSKIFRTKKRLPELTDKNDE